MSEIDAMIALECTYTSFIICLSGDRDSMTMVFPCRLCGKIYAHKSSMYTHLRLCGKEPKFSCVLCGRRFKYKHRLQSHLMSNVHALRP